jgi:hypothetical protein
MEDSTHRSTLGCWLSESHPDSRPHAPIHPLMGRETPGVSPNRNNCWNIKLRRRVKVKQILAVLRERR